ncbi:flagellar hook-length control protein [Mycobacterium sp.]|uniref:flagellar hook-length control protein n=1 Tax=Mycobacterium sp. TaxID=1785 RepID=UPI002C2EF604|nr:flagellar hook-length control protein [Mycobacterium sp.]HTQ21972.1 flagellar hook-length control protein [Mycobacterium sp.]
MSKRDAVTAALDLAEDIGEGWLDPAELDAELAEQCRQLFGTVTGPDDPLWPLHADVARQVLAAGGVSVDELSEWSAILRLRAQGDETPPKGPDVAAETDSAASRPHSPEIEGIEAEREHREDT